MRTFAGVITSSALLNFPLAHAVCADALPTPSHVPQTFDIRTTTADVGVLFIACLGVVLPTAFAVARGPSGQDEAAVLADSRATAVILFMMYGAYLAFTLWPMDKSHPPPPSASRSQARMEPAAAAAAQGDVETPLLKPVGDLADPAAAADNDDEEEDGPPTISAITIVALLIGVTALVAIYSNALVVSVFPVSAAVGIPADFIAVVLIPIVGNIAELATAVMAARHDKLDLSIAVALGSATQIALFLVPAAVMFGWAIDVPMSLDFAPTFALAFFGAVVAVALLVNDGESHWLKARARCFCCGGKKRRRRKHQRTPSQWLRLLYALAHLRRQCVRRYVELTPFPLRSRADAFTSPLTLRAPSCSAATA